MRKNSKLVVPCREPAGYVFALGLASGLALLSGEAAMAQTVPSQPFAENINGYTLQGTETPISPNAALTNGTINGSGASNVPFNVTLTQLSKSTYNYNGLVDGQAVNCTANQLSKNTYSLSGSCGFLSRVFGSGQDVAAMMAASQAAQVQTERALTREVTDLIGRRISDALSPASRTKSTTQHADANQTVRVINGGDGISGVSSGDSQTANALWATYSHSWLSNDWSALKSRTNLNTGVVGGDHKFGDNILAGITFTYQSSGATTSFNDGTLDSSTYTFVPYAAVSFLNNQLVLDVMAGGGFTDNSKSRARSTTGITGSYGSDRWLMATHATYSQPIDNWDLSAKLGWSLSYDWARSFTESDGTANSSSTTRVGELSIGGKAGYIIDQFEPYVGLTFYYDPILGPNAVGTTGSSLSRTELNALVGVSWVASDQVTASLEVSNAFLRSNENNTTVVVAARFAF